MLEIIQQSETSIDTALIKIFNALPAGYICAEVNSNKMVVKSFMSPNTQVYRLSINTDCTSEPYLIHKEKIFFNSGNKSYILWSFDNCIEIPNEFNNSSWREILHTILEETGLQSKQQSINSILPVAFQSVRSKPDQEIFSVIVNKYSGREELKDFIKHPLFKQYAVKRMKELRKKHHR